MTAFVTLCEDYIGIEPPLNLWSHFFWARLRHDLGVGAASLAKAVEEVENRINTMAANGVRWRIRSALVAVLSHFPELELSWRCSGPSGM
jgi:hypothetical protein